MMRLTFCTDFVQFVNCVLQKTYKGSLSQLVAQVLYSFYIVCMHIQKTQVHRQFHLPSQLCIVCSQLHCLYVQKTYISSFKLFSVSTLYKFCSYSLQLATFFVCSQLTMQEFAMYTRFWQLTRQLATFHRVYHTKF